MAKVVLNKYQRKVNAFTRWIDGKRAEQKITQADLARRMHKSQVAVSNKLGGKSQMTYSDLLEFFKAVNASDEEIVKMMRY